jgi:hypothetical protein
MQPGRSSVFMSRSASDTTGSAMLSKKITFHKNSKLENVSDFSGFCFLTLNSFFKKLSHQNGKFGSYLENEMVEVIMLFSLSNRNLQLSRLS